MAYYHAGRRDGAPDYQDPHPILGRFADFKTGLTPQQAWFEAASDLWQQRTEAQATGDASIRPTVTRSTILGKMRENRIVAWNQACMDADEAVSLGWQYVAGQWYEPGEREPGWDDDEPGELPPIGAAVGMTGKDDEIPF